MLLWTLLLQLSTAWWGPLPLAPPWILMMLLLLLLLLLLLARTRGRPFLVTPATRLQQPQLLRCSSVGAHAHRHA